MRKFFRNGMTLAICGLVVVANVANAQEAATTEAAPVAEERTVNNSWQVELGADFSSEVVSAGTANTSIFVLGTQFNSEPQELSSSGTGIRVGLRKNFDLSNGFYASSGGVLSFATHEHTINFDLTTARIERTSDVRNITIDQRFGYAFDFGKSGWSHVVVRPFIGVGLTLQQTETTTKVSSNNSFFNEQPTSTKTSQFLAPTIGVDVFIAYNLGLQLSVTQSQITTPSTSLIEGPTDIGEGFDMVNVFSVSAIYAF